MAEPAPATPAAPPPPESTAPLPTKLAVPAQPSTPATPPPPRATPSGRLAGATFALGAKGRLLPLSVPMRFFGAAVVFHLFAWIALAFGAGDVPRLAGGIGWPLAALHALTLGVLAMSAIGASLQLVPVATLQPLRWRRAPLAVWWLYAPGVAALLAGMAAQRPQWMLAAAVPVIAALLIFAVLLGRNLAGARGMPGVRAQGWLALASLALTLLSAAAMVAAWSGRLATSRDTWLMLHIVFAVFGFMGALALGLANILVPMFAIGPVPTDRTQLAIAALGALALALAVPVALGAWPRPALLAAVGTAAGAVGWHLRTMRRVLRDGMRRDLGGSFVLVRTGWAGLTITLALAAWWAVDAERPGLTVALLVCAVVGWLTSFLFGILQRIVPFLISMHLAGASRRAPTPSSLTDERALAVHRAGHAAALALLAIAIVADSRWAGIVAAAVGTLSALAFGRFFVRALLRAQR